MSTITKNRKAYHDYTILEKFEAGIQLQGTEVKSCRQGNVTLGEAYARIIRGELFLIGANIATYEQGNRFNHEPKRDRKLLMHKREIARLKQAVEAKGLTLVPLRMYLVRGRLKLEVGLCQGKQLHDKRQAMRQKEHDREAHRAMRSAR